MTSSNDADTPPAEDIDLVKLRSVMKATGLSKETVEEFLLAESDLDDLCNSVLAELAVPRKREGFSER